MAAIDDTARPLAPDKSGSLRLRILSAMVLAPAALIAVWLGSPLLPALVAAAAAAMAWEWGRLCRRGRSAPGLGVMIIVVVLAGVLAAALNAPQIALAVAVLGGGLVGLWSRGGGEALLSGLGVIWIALPCIALIWLAQEPRVGRVTILWVFAVVWATDIGAYVAGRAIGGPRLAPRFSPRKTWSGLIGGILCAALAGSATIVLLGLPLSVTILVLSGALAVVAQVGDLAESVAKRHFGVKDSSGLIPGHGGLLDRLDGMLAVVPAVALLSLFGGSSVVTWR